MAGMIASIVRKRVGHIYKIRLNRPAKKNAITGEMYVAITDALKEAAEDSNTRVTVITGTGDYYCAGTDVYELTGLVSADKDSQKEQVAKAKKEQIRSFVSAFIDHPKPLVAVVNGPALGIAVTTLGLCDLVIASDKATFLTPFPQLGLVPEGCSSFTFPRLMGATKALELLLGKQLTAQEAYERNLVTEIIPADQFDQRSEQIVKQLAELAPNSVQNSKALIRRSVKEELHKANEAECDALESCWGNDECIKAIAAMFGAKKSKI